MTGVSDLLATDGLALLLLGAALAGVVRGFTGFGTAMVYLPFAAQVLEPVEALVTLLVIDLIGPLPALPRALREAHRADVLRLSAGVLLGAPLGIAILLWIAPDTFRTLVSVIALLLLAALMSGLRYRGRVGRPMIYGIGAVSGVLHGAAGLPGPPVILLYMARPLPVAVIRASVLLFLVLADVVLLALFALRGLMDPGVVALGLVITVPYILCIALGAGLFDPARERTYRGVAYAIIAASALAGLPLWDR